jgi:hypothetical protein
VREIVGSIGEISIFHSRVMGLYSSNCGRFFVCRTVNWTDGQTDGRTDGQTDGQWYTIIRPVLQTDVYKLVVAIADFVPIR